jgi:hypothetical protein
VPAHAALTPNGTEYHPLRFPVQETVSYYDDFGGARQHPGNDLMGDKLDHLLAANDGTITFLRTDASGNSGNMAILTGTDGWAYWYIHVNNDTPGTDDGKNPSRWRFAPGLTRGSVVKKGQFLGYLGDSGQAETTAPHLHFELHRPNGTFIDPYTSLRLAQGAGANGLCRYPTNPSAHPSKSASKGFWLLARSGKVTPFGSVASFGNAPAPAAGNAYVAVAATPANDGYWVVDKAGAVRAFGAAQPYGGTAGKRLNASIIGLAPTPTGKGYWLLALDGGIFTFGDARFYGSTGNMRLNAPIISMASTPGGHGYWLLASDGGVFTFGDGRFYGSTGNMRLNSPVVAMAATATGAGYWLVAKDGGMFSFGDARFYGSLPGLGWCTGPAARSIARTPGGNGYWILLADGRVVPFGDAYPWSYPAATVANATALATAH